MEEEVTRTLIVNDYIKILLIGVFGDLIAFISFWRCADLTNGMPNVGPL